MGSAEAPMRSAEPPPHGVGGARRVGGAAHHVSLWVDGGHAWGVRGVGGAAPCPWGRLSPPHGVGGAPPGVGGGPPRGGRISEARRSKAWHKSGGRTVPPLWLRRRLLQPIPGCEEEIFAFLLLGKRSPELALKFPMTAEPAARAGAEQRGIEAGRHGAMRCPPTQGHEAGESHFAIVRKV